MVIKRKSFAVTKNKIWSEVGTPTRKLAKMGTRFSLVLVVVVKPVERRGATAKPEDYKRFNHDRK